MSLLKELRQNEQAVTRLSANVYDPFERAYLDVRGKEGRLLDDEQVKRLPNALEDDLHYKEWLCRKHSSEQILGYLQGKGFDYSDWLLDIGCGNGWFSNLLAQTQRANVLAVDINQNELEQAARVFKRDNLYFAYLDLLRDKRLLEPMKLICFNSSFQYFDQPIELLDLCLSLLTDDGEIHILDTPIYSVEEVAAAKQRSLDYYRQLHADNMIEFYQHHSRSLFEGYKVEWLYLPAKKSQRRNTDSPFPWLKISK